MSKYSTEDLRGYAEKIEGMWIAAAYIDINDDERMVFAVARGKKMKPTLRRAMSNGIERVLAGDQ